MVVNSLLCNIDRAFPLDRFLTMGLWRPERPLQGAQAFPYADALPTRRKSHQRENRLLSTGYPQIDPT